MKTFKPFQIVLRSLFLLITALSTVLFAQEITLIGHVYSSDVSNGLGTPVSGAHVGIAMNSVPEGTFTTTDENGYYELHFPWTWNGPIPIACEAEGYEYYYATFYPDANTSHVEYDIWLNPTSGGGTWTYLEGNVWQNNGCLGGPIGCPIEGATITAFDMTTPNGMAYTTTSDGWGHYALELPVGVYMVSCIAPGWQSETIDVEIGGNGAVHDFYLLEEGNNSEVYFSGTVSGEVSPQLPAFVPLEGAVVFLFGGFTGGILAETHTDENGYFEFGDVVMSATAVGVEAAGYLGQDHSIMELCDSTTPNTQECFPLQHDFYLNLDYQQEVATLYGLVTGQMSQMGPEFSIAGATITVTPGNSEAPYYTTSTDENGNYELQLENPDPTVAWLVTCTAEEFGTQTTEVYLVYQLEIEVNFHFTAWEEPEVPAPYDLTVELVEAGSWYPIAILDWQYPPVDDLNMPPVFNVYGQVGSNNDGWVHAATTYDTHFEMALGGVVGYNGCFYVTAVQGGVESESSNIACGEDEPHEVPPPTDLTVEILESFPPFAHLNWNYGSATDPSMNNALFQIYANWSWNEDDEWQLVGETMDTQHQFVIGDVIDMSTCFKVTAIVEGVESDPSNVACIEADPTVPAPYDLSVEYEANPLGGTAHLNWHYDNYWGIYPTFNIYVNYGWADNEWMLTGTSQTHNFEYILGDFWWPEQLCFKVTAIDPFMNVESEPSNVACADLYPDPECEDLSGLHFGDCEMVIGIGWNGEECTYYSGCGTVDQHGVDHAGSFFESMEACDAACSSGGEYGALAGEVFYQWGDAIELVAGALVQVHSSNGTVSYTTETNENGFYLIEEIPAGYYAVTCLVYTGETMTQEVEIIAGSSAIVDFWFGEPYYKTALMGVVWEENSDHAIYGAHIMAHGPDGVIIETWNDDGGYWLSLPGPGTYYFTVSAEGYYDIDATFDVQGIFYHDFYLTPMDDGNPGDINGDGEVNVLDVVALVNFIIAVEDPTDAEFAAGDLNQDGQLDVLDVVLMVNAILSGDPLSEDCYTVPEVGPCDGICPTYYYNQDSGECEEFITGCCGVEAFHNMEACVEVCE